MTFRDEPLEAAEEPIPVEVALSEPTTDDLSALGEVDRQGRIGRTSVQVGIPGSLVVIGSWAAALAEWDLDPGPGRDLPATVAAAFVAVVGVLIARWMNRPLE